MMKFDALTHEQYIRLCECRSRKSDIVAIARAYMLEKSYNAEDALITALEHLDMNGQFFDLTGNEWNAYKNKLS